MQSKLKNTILLSSTSFLLLTTLLSLAGYGQNPTGTLRGNVQDPKGARVASATIVVQAAGSSLQARDKKLTTTENSV